MTIKVNGKEVENISTTLVTDEVKSIVLPLLFFKFIISKKELIDRLKIIRQSFKDFCYINFETFKNDEFDEVDNEDEDEDDFVENESKKSKPKKNPYNFKQMLYLDEFLKIFDWIDYLTNNTKENEFELEVSSEYSDLKIWGEVRNIALYSFENIVKGYSYKNDLEDIIFEQNSKMIKAINFMLKNHIPNIKFKNSFKTISLNKLVIVKQSGFLKINENFALESFYQEYAKSKFGYLEKLFPKISFVINERTKEDIKHHQISFSWYINSNDIVKLQKKNIFLFVEVKNESDVNEYCVIDIKHNLANFIYKFKEKNVNIFGRYLNNLKAFEYVGNTDTITSFNKKYDKLQLDVKAIRSEEKLFIQKL